MRLINARKLQLENFFQGNILKYAILSHTWGDDEVTLQQFEESAESTKILDGYLKIENTCVRALQNGIEYVWVDTCCIDKTSSTELSEAINSMFRWYEEAEVCYAYLGDVAPRAYGPDDQFSASRWFTRGWTLQELIAPRHLEFLASDWSFISTRQQLASRVAAITRIDQEYLEHSTDNCRDLMDKASVAERMSWASNRNTTREEDIAYCLLGIFGISMPLIYGEGMKAFQRLQKEILLHSFDPSILVWNPIHDGQVQKFEDPEPYSPVRFALKSLVGSKHPWCSALQELFIPAASGVLAPSPACFQHCNEVASCEMALGSAVTNGGLKLTVAAGENRDPYIIIPCRLRNDPLSLLSVPLALLADQTFLRSDSPVKIIGHHFWHMWPQRELLLKTTEEMGFKNLAKTRCGVFIQHLPPQIRFLKAYSADGSVQDGVLIKIRSTLHERNLEYQERVALLFHDQASDEEFCILIRLYKSSQKIEEFNMAALLQRLWLGEFHVMGIETLDCRFVKPAHGEKIKFLLRKNSAMHHLPQYLERENSGLHIRVPRDYLPEFPIFKLHLEPPPKWLASILQLKITLTKEFWKQMDMFSPLDQVLITIFSLINKMFILFSGASIQFYFEWKYARVFASSLAKAFITYFPHNTIFYIFCNQPLMHMVQSQLEFVYEAMIKALCALQLLPLIAWFAPRMSGRLRIIQWPVAFCFGIWFEIAYPSKFQNFSFFLVGFLFISRALAGGQDWVADIRRFRGY